MSNVEQPLPDRDCRTKTKAKQMADWCNAMLDRFERDERPLSLEQAMERADQEGNTEPLRRVLKQLTGHHVGRFLRKPQRNHGQHFQKARHSDPVTDAAIDAKIIWWLWKWNYPKQPVGVNAVQIAAARHKVSVDKVKSRTKKLSVEIPPKEDIGKTGFVRFPRGQSPIWYWWNGGFV